MEAVGPVGPGGAIVGDVDYQAVLVQHGVRLLQESTLLSREGRVPRVEVANLRMLRDQAVFDIEFLNGEGERYRVAYDEHDGEHADGDAVAGSSVALEHGDAREGGTDQLDEPCQAERGEGNGEQRVHRARAIVVRVPEPGEELARDAFESHVGHVDHHEPNVASIAERRDGAQQDDDGMERLDAAPFDVHERQAGRQRLG